MATTYTFTLRPGITLVDATFNYGGQVWDVDAMLTSGEGEIVTTNDGLASALRSMRADNVPLLDEASVASSEEPDQRRPLPLYAQADTPTPQTGFIHVVTDGAGNPTGSILVNDGDGSGSVELPVVNKSHMVVHVRDYVTPDGTTDNVTEIKSAVDAATNVTVVFARGDYRISAPIRRTSTGGVVNLVFEEGATITPTNDYAVDGTHTAFISLRSLTAGSVTGATIVGNSDNVSGSTFYGLDIRDSSRVVVEQCALSDMPHVGMWIGNCDDVRLARNDVSDVGNHGIFFYDCNRVVVDGNTVIGRGDDGTQSIGILGQTSERAIITRNFVKDTPDTGTKTEGCHYVVYANNVVEDSGKDGIKVQNYAAEEVSPVYHAVVTGNVIRRLVARRPDGSALVLLHDVESGVVANNVCEGGGTRLENSVRVTTDETAPKRIVVANNVGLLTGSNAVYADAAENLLITGNNFSKNIRLADCAGTVAVKGNTVEYEDGVTPADYAVQFDTFQGGNIAVENNALEGAVLIGVDGGSTTESVRVRGNTIAGSPNYGARVANFDTGVGADIAIVDISANTFAIAPSSLSAFAVRIGLADLDYEIVRVTDNTFRQSGSTITSGLELFGSGNAIPILDFDRNRFLGTFTTKLNDTSKASSINQGAPVLAGSETKAWGSLADGAQATEDVTVTGAVLGDFAVASMGVNLQGMTLSAHVSAADTVTCVLRNNTGGAVDLASSPLRVRVLKTAY